MWAVHKFLPWTYYYIKGVNMLWQWKLARTVNVLTHWGRDKWHFLDDIFKCIFLNETVLISIKNSLKFVTKGHINNIPALVYIMAWRWPGDKPLSEPRMESLLTHICVTRPQWVKKIGLSARQSVCRKHGFRSVSYACLRIWIWNSICILAVAIDRTWLIFNDVTFKMAACHIGYFCFRTLTSVYPLNINSNIQ